MPQVVNVTYVDQDLDGEIFEAHYRGLQIDEQTVLRIDDQGIIIELFDRNEAGDIIVGTTSTVLADVHLIHAEPLNIDDLLNMTFVEFAQVVSGRLKL